MKLTLGYTAIYRDQVLTMLRAEVRALGSQKAAAAAMKVSPQHLHDMLNDRRRVTGNALNYLGLDEITVYYRIGGDKRGAA